MMRTMPKKTHERSSVKANAMPGCTARPREDANNAGKTRDSRQFGRRFPAQSRNSLKNNQPLPDVDARKRPPPYPQPISFRKSPTARFCRLCRFVGRCNEQGPDATALRTLVILSAAKDLRGATCILFPRSAWEHSTSDASRRPEAQDAPRRRGLYSGRRARERGSPKEERPATEVAGRLVVASLAVAFPRRSLATRRTVRRRPPDA
jgi:hypothetical protein